jgi:hypothetical protein
MCSSSRTRGATIRPGFAFEMWPRHRRPAAFAADPRHHRRVVRPELFARPLVGCGDVSGRVRANRERAVAEVSELFLE